MFSNTAVKTSGLELPFVFLTLSLHDIVPGLTTSTKGWSIRTALHATFWLSVKSLSSYKQIVHNYDKSHLKDKRVTEPHLFWILFLEHVVGWVVHSLKLTFILCNFLLHQYYSRGKQDLWFHPKLQTKPLHSYHEHSKVAMQLQVLQQSLDIWKSNLLWPPILIPLFWLSATDSDKSTYNQMPSKSSFPTLLLLCRSLSAQSLIKQGQLPLCFME